MLFFTKREIAYKIIKKKIPILLNCIKCYFWNINLLSADFFHQNFMCATCIYKYVLSIFFGGGGYVNILFGPIKSKRNFLLWTANNSHLVQHVSFFFIIKVCRIRENMLVFKKWLLLGQNGGQLTFNGIY